MLVVTIELRFRNAISPHLYVRSSTRGFLYRKGKGFEPFGNYAEDDDTQWEAEG